MEPLSDAGVGLDGGSGAALRLEVLIQADLFLYVANTKVFDLNVVIHAVMRSFTA